MPKDGESISPFVFNLQNENATEHLARYLPPAVIKILWTPFPEDLIQSRKIPGGKTVEYVSVDHYREKMFLAFGGRYSWQIADTKFFDIYGRACVGDMIPVEIAVRGRMTIAAGPGTNPVPVCLERTGVTKIKMQRQKEIPVSVANDVAVAEAMAYKACCGLLGIGWEIGMAPPDSPMEVIQEPSGPSRNAETGPVPRTHTGRVQTPDEYRKSIREALRAKWGDLTPEEARKQTADLMTAVCGENKPLSRVTLDEAQEILRRLEAA